MPVQIGSILRAATTAGGRSRTTLPEPAWHRRARKRRTAARTLLRNFLSGTTISHREVQDAAAVLAGHHSASPLALRAVRVLQSRQDRSICFLVVPWLQTVDTRLGGVLSSMWQSLGSCIPGRGYHSCSEAGWAAREAQSFQSQAGQITPRTRWGQSPAAVAATAGSPADWQRHRGERGQGPQGIGMGPRQGVSESSKAAFYPFRTVYPSSACYGSQVPGGAAGPERVQGQPPGFGQGATQRAGRDAYRIQSLRDAQACACPGHEVQEAHCASHTARSLHGAVVSLRRYSGQKSRDSDCGEGRCSANFLGDGGYPFGGDRRGHCRGAAIGRGREIADRGLGGSGSRASGPLAAFGSSGPKAARGRPCGPHAACGQGCNCGCSQAGRIPNTASQGRHRRCRQACGRTVAGRSQGCRHASSILAIFHCIAQACGAISAQGGFTVDPLLGQGPNGAFGGGVYHPPSLMHSVCGQPDFVSTWLARSDAIFLEFEVNVTNLQFQHGDADYGVWKHTLQRGESTWPVVADPGQHDDTGDSPPHGQYGRVESHCLSCCPADEATPAREDILSASPRIVHNACLHRKDPAEAVAAFEFSETRCARRCSRTETSSGLCSMPQCKDAFKKVRFCPSVSFWFPAKHQLLMSRKSKVKGSSDVQLPAPSFTWPTGSPC